MENASKALTIAGGVMMGIMVVGLLIFGFQRIRSFQNTKDESVKTAQLSEFNSSLEAYNKNVIPGYQMISLANLVSDLNKRAKDESYDEIKIKVDMKFPTADSKFGIYEQSDFNDFVDFITNKYPNLNDNGDNNSKKAFKEMYFQCKKVDSNKVNGRINKMEFEKITKK